MPNLTMSKAYLLLLLIVVYFKKAESAEPKSDSIAVNNAYSTRDLASDVQLAVQAGDAASNATMTLYTSLTGVDSILITQVEVLVGNIIYNLFAIGANNSNLLGLQIIIDHAEAVIVYQVYEQTHAVLDHSEIIQSTQNHLQTDLSLIANDRDLLATNINALNVSMNQALIVIKGEVDTFNNEVNALIQGMSGPEVTEIQVSLATVNRILENTKNDLTADKINMENANAAYFVALDVVIAQVP